MSIVLNFVDMLSHARTESKMIRELAQSEAAYRSLTNHGSSTLLRSSYSNESPSGEESNRYDRSWNDPGNESDQGDR